MNGLTFIIDEQCAVWVALNNHAWNFSIQMALAGNSFNRIGPVCCQWMWHAHPDAK